MLLSLDVRTAAVEASPASMAGHVTRPVTSPGTVSRATVVRKLQADIVKLVRRYEVRMLFLLSFILLY